MKGLLYQLKSDRCYVHGLYLICFRLPPVRAAVMLALITLSAFVPALIGLFIGRI